MNRYELSASTFGTQENMGRPLFNIGNEVDDGSCGDHASEISSLDNMDNLNYFEQNMAKLFDDLLDEQLIQEKRSSQPLESMDTNRPGLFKNSSFELKDKSKRFAQQFKAAQLQKNYLNNTSEILKSLLSPISSSSKSVSPKKAFNRAIKQRTSLSSVRLFRSINNSHTICVEPTDVLEPLNEGEFTEYKLFPTSAQSKPKLTCQDHSLSLSCSNHSSLSSSMANSPNNNY